VRFPYFERGEYMAVRRIGSPIAFWNNAAVGINGTSAAIMLPRGGEQCAFYVTTSAATTISVQVAHHGVLSIQGVEPDESAVPTNWFLLYYINTPAQIVFAAAGSISMIVPDFEPAWIRLQSSAAATITAGYELSGE
jgi:hypothetical protein